MLSVILTNSATFVTLSGVTAREHFKQADFVSTIFVTPAVMIYLD